MGKQNRGGGRSTFRSRLFLKFIIPYILLIVTVLSLSGWFFYSSAKGALDAELSRRLVGVANLVTRSINPQFLMRLRPGDEDTSLYRLLLGELAKIQEATQVKDIHIFDRENRMIVDLDGTQPIGEENLLLQIDSIELEKVWNGASLSSVLYRGKDGRFYKAGYAPFQREGGQVLAAVGVEVGVDFMQIMDQVKGQFFWITLVGAGCIVLISFVLSRSMIRPIQHLATATEQLGKKGVYPKVDLQRRDELGDLGSHFNQMIDQIRAKDALLQEMYRKEKARVEELEGVSQTLLKNIPSGVLSVDLSGRVTSCNPAAENIFGLPAASILGKEIGAGLGPFQPLAELILITLKAGQEASRQEFSIEDPSRGKRWIGVVTSLLKDAGGEQMGATAVFSDLTEVRKLQEEIQLKQQLALLGELSAGVAHEIRNPLAAIQALVELLARKSSGDLEGLAQEVVEEVGHLNRFVTEFLRFARLPALHLEEADVEELIEGALSLAIPEGKHNKVAVRKTIPKALPPVYVDPVEFRRVLLNVILNAVQAMKEEGELRIDAKAAHRHVVIQVSDTGSGIALENQNKVFRPFFTTKQGGTGLGLAISHRIMTSHRGGLSFKSSEGKGTTFMIEVPVYQERKQ